MDSLDSIDCCDGDDDYGGDDGDDHDHAHVDEGAPDDLLPSLYGVRTSTSGKEPANT